MKLRVIVILDYRENSPLGLAINNRKTGAPIAKQCFTFLSGNNEGKLDKRETRSG